MARGVTMSKTKVYKIDCLAKYIQQLNKVENVPFYRGEAAVYPSRQSSALRPYKFRWNSAEPFPFMKMIDEFYKETAYKLDEDKGDFIAFAQHHGILTNILDVTTSPLTALYFACQGDDVAEGVVYVGIPEYIDVTNLVHKYPNENLIESVFSNTVNELMLLVPLFTRYKKEYPEDFAGLLDELIDAYLFYFPTSLDDNKQKFYNKLKRRKFDVWECIGYLREAFVELKDFSLSACDEELYFYLALQFIFFKQARMCKEPIYTINFLPNMVYRPILKFERGRNQQGLFLYQGYMTYIEPVYNFRVLAQQQLCFQNVEFHVKNKAQIMMELDRIGINKKTLFCDYDSIAQYITEKYSVLNEADKLS